MKVLYTILIKYVTSIKLIWIPEMFLNETYRKKLIYKITVKFPTQNGLKHRDALLSLLSNFIQE